MNIVTYGITQDVYEFNNKQIVSYGIVAYVNNDTETIVTSVRDISTNKNKVESMIRRFNKLALSLIHLYDVVEDELGE